MNNTMVVSALLSVLFGLECFGQPHIDKLYPRILKTNTEASLSILGNGFTDESLVSINGSTPIQPETPHSAFNLGVTVKKELIPTDGRYDVVVINRGSPATSSNVVSFDASQTAVSGLNLVVGIGSLLNGHHTDYKVNSATNVLQATTIGLATPQLLAGLSFRLPAAGFNIKNNRSVHKPWEAFVSLKFAPGTAQTLSGYVVGVSYRVASHLSLLTGFALTPFMEPSPGFTKAAAAAVRDPATASFYPTFNAAGLESNAQNAFDGFPLKQPLPAGGSSSTANLYPGDPLETRYRGGWLFGISVPVSVGSLLGVH